MVGERKHGVGGEQSMHSCLQCSSKFKRKFDLTRHIKSVHNPEKIKCEHCESSFGRKDDLARHKRRKHTLQKCEECEFSTCEKCGLEYHMLEKHEGEALVELTYQKKHKCIYCNHSSDSARNVRRHVEKKHPGNNTFLTNVAILKTYKCKFCNYSSDRAQNVRRHVEKKHVEKQNEKKTPQKVVMENHTTVDEAALENSIVSESNEFMRKLELGRELMRIITEKNIMKASLSVEHAEALELFEKHKQDNDVKPVVWRPWQKELLKYVNNPTDRRIIWVVGGEGNEGKTFFMKKIEEQYGSHRFYRNGLWVPTWWIFEDKEGDVDVARDIFLFDIYRSIVNLKLRQHHRLTGELP